MSMELYLACVVEHLLSAKHINPGLSAGRVRLLRVSEGSGVETHTRCHTCNPGCREAVVQGCMQSSLHHDIIYTTLYFVDNLILLGQPSQKTSWRP